MSLVVGANSLLFLRNALEHVDADWDASFTTQVATLESAGVATNSQVAAMGETYSAVVSQALDVLEALLNSKLPISASLEEDEDE